MQLQTTHQNPEDLLPVLKSSLYVGASDASVRMVLSYCAAAGLDPLQKPVHIVPMWDSKAGSMKDVIMPGINLYRIQAMRSGCAGISEPEFGPTIKRNLGGVEVEYPEWCRVTVKRQLSNGTIAEFTARELWIENYAEKGGKEKSKAPNSMWSKRPSGQLAKCAQAQALRMAFPEIASAPTAEEMEGKPLIQEDRDREPKQPTVSEHASLQREVLALARQSSIPASQVTKIAKKAGIEVEVVGGKETLPTESLRQVRDNWASITAPEKEPDTIEADATVEEDGMSDKPLMD
jgi:phage recombination protein Bet